MSFRVEWKSWIIHFATIFSYPPQMVHYPFIIFSAGLRSQLLWKWGIAYWSTPTIHICINSLYTLVHQCSNDCSCHIHTTSSLYRMVLQLTWINFRGYRYFIFKIYQHTYLSSFCKICFALLISWFWHTDCLQNYLFVRNQTQKTLCTRIRMKSIGIHSS